MMNILMTGVTGFIGSHLLRALSGGGYQLICAVRSENNKKALGAMGIPLQIVNLQDAGALDKALAKCDTVIHLAGLMGEYGVSYDKYHRINCELTKYLLYRCDKNRVKQFIFCSTPGVYGFSGRLCDETTPYAPRNDYEKTKALAEQEIVSYCQGADIKYTLLRPDFVYGPGDLRRLRMYRSIKNRKFVLTTNGKSYLHPTYIDDVVQAFLLCINNPSAENEVFNVAAMEDITAGGVPFSYCESDRNKAYPHEHRVPCVDRMRYDD